jgi:hypothetical protein
VWRWTIFPEITHIDAESREYPADREPSCSISCTSVLDQREKHISNRSYGGECGNNVPSHPIFIRAVRNRNAKDEGREVARGCEALSITGRIAQLINDGWGEVGEAGEGIIATEMNDAVQPTTPVGKSLANLAPVQCAFYSGVSGLKALDCLSLLALREKLGSAWRVCEEEVHEWGEQDCWGSLYICVQEALH